MWACKVSVFVEHYTDTRQRKLASRKAYAWEVSLAGWMDAECSPETVGSFSVVFLLVEE